MQPSGHAYGVAQLIRRRSRQEAASDSLCGLRYGSRCEKRSYIDWIHLQVESNIETLGPADALFPISQSDPHHLPP